MNVCVQKAFNLLIYKCLAAKVASVFCFICGAHMIWPRKYLPKNMKKIPAECACFGLYLKILYIGLKNCVSHLNNMLQPKNIFVLAKKIFDYSCYGLKKTCVGQKIFDYSCCGLKKYLLANKKIDYSCCGLKNIQWPTQYLTIRAVA